MNRLATRAALAAYIRNSGPGERQEPRDWQASDLITDLLLMFDEDTADQILHRVERDTAAERADAMPVYRAS